MKQPFFSLITPVYNIEKLLGITVNSALSQTFGDWEMILVDDGSPDNAGALCDEFAAKDERIRVIHKQNEGLAAARNTGIEACSGKYFIILEGSDMLYDENTLALIHKTLCEKEVDIYFGKLQDVMETGMEVTNVQADYCVNGLFEEGGRALFVKLAENNDVLALSSPVNKVFRTAFVKENELWFYKGIYHDDDEWLPRAISLSSTSYFTNEIIYDALTWDGCLGKAVSDRSLTKKACDKMLIARHCCEDIDERFPEKNTPFKKTYYEYFVRMYVSSIPSIKVVKDEECLKKIEESIKEHQKVFDYAAKCNSKNLKMLSIVKKLFGLNFAKKLILRRYR